MRDTLREICEKLCKLAGKGECSEEGDTLQRIEECLRIVEEEINEYSKQLEEYSMTMEAHLEELTRTYEELATVFEVNKILGEFEYPYKTLEKVKKVLGILRNAIPYRAVVVKLETPDESISYREGEFEKLDEITEKLERTEVKSVILLDSLKESDFGRINLLVVPVKSMRKSWGYIALIEKVEGIFTAADRKMLESISQQISSALDRIAFMKDEIERQRMREQLEIAKNIQMGLFPKTLPRSDRISLAASSSPAIHVGGDYYDALKFGDGILAVVADVSGKGIPAALLMSSTRSALRSMAKTISDVRKLVYELNNMLCEDLSDDRFITMVAMFLSDDGRLTLVNAGHDPVYIVKDGEISSVDAEGVPLGILPDFEFEEKVVEVPEGAFIVAYTDGVPEARNLEGEEFGFERLEEVLSKLDTDDPRKALETIKSSVFEFSKGAPQHDDTTIMVIRYS